MPSTSVCQETITVDVEKVKRESQIYMLNPDDKLLEYHRSINDNAFAIAKQNPHLLTSKNELQKLARRRLHESGFAYKKKQSRSKDFGTKTLRQRKNQENKS